MIEVTSKLILKEIKTPEDIINLLTTLGNIDADFCGDNGEDYLWDDAKASGFHDNATYLANEIIFHSSVDAKHKGLHAYTEEFAKRWLKRDSYYRNICIDLEKFNSTDVALEGIYAACIIATYDS